MRKAKNLDLALHAYPDQFMEYIGMPPDPWQKEFLCTRAKNSLLLCGRQTGKSTTTAMAVMHEAEFYAPALILLLSPSERQSKEILKKAQFIFHRFHGMNSTNLVHREGALFLEMNNGSRILAMPGSEDTIRGYSGVSLLVIDEASRVNDSLYYAVRPMMATSGGRLVALTTPFGKRGFFYDAWQKDNDWLKIKATSEDCPRIPKSFLQEEKDSLPDFWYRQEYLCEFLDPIDSIFTYEQIMSAMDKEIEPLFAEGELI